MKTIPLILSLLITSCDNAHTVLSPQTGTIAGAVFDATTFVPIDSANIIITLDTLLTDVTGVFTIDLPPGEYYVVVEKVGYETFPLLAVVKNGAVTPPRIPLVSN